MNIRRLLFALCFIFVNPVQAEETDLIRMLKETKVKAAQKHLFNMVKQHGADVNVLQGVMNIVRAEILDKRQLRSHKGAYEVALKKSRNEFTIPELIDYINQQDDGGRTALHYAAALAQYELMIMLIILGAYRYTQDQHGNTAAHFAIKRCSEYDGNEKHTEYVNRLGNTLVETLRVLLYCNGYREEDLVNMQNKHGDTLMHLLITHSLCMFVLARCIDMPVDYGIQNKDGLTPEALVKKETRAYKEEYGKVVFRKIGDVQSVLGFVYKQKYEKEHGERLDPFEYSAQAGNSVPVDFQAMMGHCVHQ